MVNEAAILIAINYRMLIGPIGLVNAFNRPDDKLKSSGSH